MAGPCLPDLTTIYAAGIDPKTGLPIKLANTKVARENLKSRLQIILRIQDEQRAVNRYKWYNLPAGISSQELERLLYYKYQLVFFYMPDLDKFYFMPFALDGTIDFYGRYNTVHPVPMTSGAEKEEQSGHYKQKAELLSKIKLNIQHDVVLYKGDITEELLTKSGVILRDYTPQLSYSAQPRQMLNDCLLDLQSDCLCFMRTNLLLGTGIQGLRVPDADSKGEVDAAAQKMYEAAISGNPYTAITGKIDFQELQPKSTLKSEEYFLAFQSIDNILLSTYGIDNSGVYEKKAHILEEESEVNFNQISLINQDGLSQRQNFCNIVNSIWGFGIWCEESESIVGDTNGDGVSYDEGNDGSNSGSSVKPEEEGGEK